MPPPIRKGPLHSPEKLRNAKMKKAIVSWIRRVLGCYRDLFRTKFKRPAALGILLLASLYSVWLSSKAISKLKMFRPSKCVGSTVMSAWTQTPLHDPRYFPQYYSVADFMEGPALTHPHPTAAVCKFRDITFWYHFPHAYVNSVVSRALLVIFDPLIFRSSFPECSSCIDVPLGGLRIQPKSRFYFLTDQRNCTTNRLFVAF
jgi:hypothetical protein